MTASMYPSLIFTVVLLAITVYSLMGSLPLLVLKHDTPQDSWFIRGFFNTYYRVAIVVAAATAVSYAIAGRPAYALGAAALASLVALLRGNVVARMDVLRSRIAAEPADAIAGFRRTHLAAIAANALQLSVIVWALTTLSL